MEHLIPPEWFVGLPWWSLLLIAVASLFALAKGADWLVEGASSLAHRLGMPKVIIGATIVSLGTTSPECAVSVMAAWKGEPGLALGNAVGSIIADAALIFGLGCVIATLPADRFVLQRQGWVQFGSGVLLAVLCYLAFFTQGDEATLDRWVGVLFLALLAVYMYMSVRWAKQHPSGEPFITTEDVQETTPITPLPEHAERSVPATVGAMLLGLVVVIVSSHVLISAVSELALQWGVPKVVIAGTLVALGTSLPELVVGMASIRKGHPELLVGNVIGADILNVLFVTGAAAVAAPLPIVEPHADVVVSRIFLYLHLPVMLLVLLIFRIYIFDAVKRGHFQRWFGYPFLAIYAFYAIAQYYLSREGGTLPGM